MSCLLAFLIGPLVVRFTGLAQIMVTLTLALIAYEIATKATWLTGGDDGLGGFEFDKVLGIFGWSVYSETAYLYTLAWLFVLFMLSRKLVASPFGLALQGFRENRNRMLFLGAPIRWHLLRVYAFSAFVAGVADDGQTLPLDDPLAGPLREAVAGAGDDPAAQVRAVFRVAAVAPGAFLPD